MPEAALESEKIKEILENSLGDREAPSICKNLEKRDSEARRSSDTGALPWEMGALPLVKVGRCAESDLMYL
jgi:hypothetical protein